MLKILSSNTSIVLCEFLVSPFLNEDAALLVVSESIINYLIVIELPAIVTDCLTKTLAHASFFLKYYL
jgi:hypothetical protein